MADNILFIDVALSRDGSSLSLQDGITIENNVALSTPGGGALQIASENPSDHEINADISNNVVFCDNRAPSGSGGAIMLSGHLTVGLRISGNVAFEDNHAGRGGELALTGEHATVDVIGGVSFRRNSATEVGGAISLVPYTQTAGQAMRDLYLLHCRDDVLLEANVAGERGGGIYAQGLMGGGMKALFGRRRHRAIVDWSRCRHFCL